MKKGVVVVFIIAGVLAINKCSDYQNDKYETDPDKIVRIMKDKGYKLKCWGRIKSCEFGRFDVDKDTTKDSFIDDYGDEIKKLGVSPSATYEYLEDKADQEYEIATKKVEKKENETVDQTPKEQTKNSAPVSNSSLIEKYGRSAIQDSCKHWVDVVLKAPSTAKYPGSLFNPDKDWSYSEENGIITVSSYVDSQNSFGAVTRANFVVKMQIKDNVGECIYLSVDGTVYKQ